MVVRLTVKLAEVVNGVDLSHHREGDLVELSVAAAQMLLAEGWAERVDDSTLESHPPWRDRAIAADRVRKRRG